MDLMNIRRGLLAQMARGAEVLRGTFTTGTTSPYTISFGKTFSTYLFFIEMTDESKTQYLSDAVDSSRTYAFCGCFPIPKINNGAPSDMGLTYKYNPVTEAYRNDYGAMTIEGDRIQIPNTDAQNALLKGYSYNYIIVSLDNA